MSLDRQYRRLFALYPRDYRRYREDEMVSVLLESEGGRRKLVPASEAGAIVSHAFQARLWASEEWRNGSAIGGLCALALVASIVTAGLGISFQVDQIRVVTQAWWAILAVGLVTFSLNHRVATSQAVGTLAAAFGVLAGASLTGLTRGQTLPLLLTIGLVNLSLAAPERWRQAAAGIGSAGGAVFLVFFQHRSAMIETVGPRPTDPWRLALGIVDLRAWMVLLMLTAGLLFGMWRRRFSIAACLLALPSVLFVQGINTGRVQFSYQVATAGAAFAAVTIYGLTTLIAMVAASSHGDRRVTSSDIEV